MSIIVSSSKPTGIEAAGEISYFLNGSISWFSSYPSNLKAKVTIITKANRLLPILSKPYILIAKTFLNKVSVNIIYNVSIILSITNANSKTTINLSNGKQQTTNIYIPTQGITPNSKYIPADLKNDQGYIKTNGITLRANAAGTRVYVAGDISNYSCRGFYNLYSAIPILITNIKRNLLAAAASNKLDTKPKGLDCLFT